MEQLKQWINRHPNLTAWLVLALGMVAILVVEARQVGLEARQWFWLIIITILVAGACVWIIGWGDDEDSPEGEKNESKKNKK